ncbi:MAG: histidine--tRNA ligase [Sedimentisphaerales bacterium]|nr:histidine--tRNA ligase [Sedimentisphaerales bacterium]
MAKIPPVKGTRDFYPELMAQRNWITDGWRAVSCRNGFVEYDGPIFEHLQLFTQKSGPGIASELFSLTDRGGRDLAIRPEMTPTLARMVNQQINALPRPIKWFSMPRCCRAERPQKGRLREFFQWNADIIGSDSVLADAECIYTALDYLRSVGLTAEDVEAKISSRSMLAALLVDAGFAEDELDPLYQLLDKKPKLPAEAFNEMVEQQVPDAAQRENIMRLQAVRSLDELDSLAQSDAAKESLAELRELFALLGTMGVADYCRFDISIVRGLAYYTGPVFEIFDKSAALRAVGAGGRYDNLLAGLGGQKVSGTGFGMGDVVLGILLEEKGLLRSANTTLDYFVVDAGPELFTQALELVCQLRQQGFAAGFDYRRTNIGKQMKQAASQGAREVLILGQETIDKNEITIKDMAQGTQKTMQLEDFMAEIEQR